MDIQIKYGNGQMNIHMAAFFPTSQVRLKKLLKVVDLDFEHRDEIIQTMQQFFQDKVKELEEKRTSSGKKAVDYKQKIADTNAIIESRKHSNGVKLTKDELADMKEQNKHFKAVYAGCASEFNRSIRQKDLFLKHLEILKQRK
jgi:hypothetical protein|nr:MAG TPA: hypothetical protein [Caudoviricetes sp.]